ncbi:sodium-dependent glucose transporter 1A-like [Galendromus occidentalis]|uniref:Major facilitator superfamily domain-containing protein 4A n=1 Tax=Galendromus occidentalis TaxID=34638 RepID=A0AAJ6QWK4_9ACAR|nr:sodium-dependent glucose transporter 1A-like [Galendromus occidentalis]
MTKVSERSAMDWWHTANLILVVFGVGLVNSLLGPSLIDLGEIYASAPNEVAVMNSYRALGLFIGSCVGGFLYERINDQILMIAMGVIYGAGTVLNPVLPDLNYFHVLGFSAGVSIGICHIVYPMRLESLKDCEGMLLLIKNVMVKEYINRTTLMSTSNTVVKKSSDDTVQAQNGSRQWWTDEGSQVRLVKIWAEDSAPAIQAIHASYGVGATIGPFLGAPFLSSRENGLIVRESELHVPYAASGFLYLLILVSMVGAYFADPVGIQKAKENERAADADSDGTFETLLMTLLFFYLTISVNSESTFSTLISVYAFASPSLQFSKADAAYLAGVFWTTFTGGRIVSIFIAAFFDVKQLLLVSHSLVLCASGILVVFGGSAACTWIGVAMMGSGVSSMYGAAKALVFNYFHLRHFHISVILTGACLGIAIPAYFVPPVVESWPMFLPYYTGCCNITHLLILLLMFRAVRGKQTIHARKGDRHRVSKENVVV